MSALPRQKDLDAFGYLGLRMQAGDFLGLGQTRERYELVHGVVCMSPRPNTLHQRLSSVIQFQLEVFIRQRRSCRYFADVDLVIAEDTVYAPDIAAYRPRRVKGYPMRLDAPPDLIIEILSHGTKAFDLTTKREDYDKFGVREYWTYDPTEKGGKLRCARRVGKALVDVPVAGDKVKSTGLPGFVLDVRVLREV